MGEAPQEHPAVTALFGDVRRAQAGLVATVREAEAAEVQAE